MRLTILLLFVGVISGLANETYSQSAKLNLVINNASVENILKSIEEQSEFRFFYNENIDVDRKLSLHFEQKSIEEILDAVFDNTDVNYSVNGRIIALATEKISSEVLNSLVGQQKPITGKVTDSNNVPIPGVTIVVKGTATGTITDGDGNYRINAKNGDVLVFSFIGMKSNEAKVTAQEVVNVKLEEETIGLEEVVAVGYGSVKKKDLTGSVGTVDAEALVARGATGVLESMQGSIAGVNISRTSARPGAAFDIQIRGLNSFESSVSPLYVVDGIVSDNINFLNPSDIIKIDILKDASSTAIYGSRGSNGVVLVTTKNANDVKEGKAIVSYTGSVGIKTSARLPKQYTGRDWFDYRSHAYLQYAPDAGDNGMEDWKIVLSGIYMANPEAARRAYDQENTDWLGEILQHGMQNNHYLNVAGNSGKMSFNMGIGYQDEEGIYIKENLKRYNMKLSLNYKISEKVEVGATANMSQSNIESGNSKAYQQTTRMSPIFKIYDEAGDLLIQPGLVANMGGVGNNFTGNTNPVWEIENGSDNQRRHDILAAAFIQLKPIKDVTIKSVIQPRFTRNREASYTEMSTSASQRAAESSNVETFDYTWDNILNYDKSYNQHNFKLTGIHSVFSSRVESLEVSVNTLPYNSEWYNLFSGTLDLNNSSSGYSEVKMLSYLGRLNYDYAGKYYLTTSLRYDGSSKLADKWATFSSFALAWRLSEESFLKANFLSNLKLRYSYGQSGNNNISAYTTFLGPEYTSSIYYNYGDTGVSGFTPGVPVNTKLTWEKTNENNLGVDFGFFGERISGTVEVYNRLSEGLLMDRKLAIESGVSEMTDNIGSARNRGIEVSLNTVNIQTRDFRWSTSFTFAKNKNEIVSLYGRKEDVVGENRFIGEPINVIYDYQFNGVFSTPEAQAAAGNQLFSNYNPNPGHAKVVDTSGDGAITTDDKIILGTPDPKWIGGFTTSVQYKNFDLNLSLIANTGRFVRDQFAANAISRNSRSQMMWADPEDYYYPQDAPRPDWDNPITDTNGNITGIGFSPAPEENTDAKYPAYGSYQGPYYSAEAMNYRKVSFVKIKNISLGYNLSKDVISKIGLSKARLYLNVLDPVVFSNYVGWDPEYTTTSAVNGNGPSSITCQFGVNVEF
ncbi:TonB-dependent receptor [Mangrovibacterium sp.]|uniref:TonB-dependent receptor n=1 Tax=Mangrovibacterium sp. TaxID=1961364 RepID=UPI003569CCD1